MVGDVVVEVVLQLVFFVFHLDGVVSVDPELLHLGEGSISQRRFLLNPPPQPFDLFCSVFEFFKEGWNRVFGFYFFLESVAAVDTHDGELEILLGDASQSSLSRHDDE
jgi:hypothetical protein